MGNVRFPVPAGSKTEARNGFSVGACAVAKVLHPINNRQAVTAEIKLVRSSNWNEETVICDSKEWMKVIFTLIEHFTLSIQNYFES